MAMRIAPRRHAPVPLPFAGENCLPPRLSPMLAALALAAPAIVSARPMTPGDVARTETVGTFEISPDGTRIAYTTIRRPDVTRGEENGGPRAQLMLAWGADNNRAWLPRDVSVDSLRFSPDGRQIAYIWAAEDDNAAVWAMPVDGGAPAKLAGLDDAGVEQFEWLGDDRLVLLATARKDPMRTAEAKAGFDAIIYEEEQKFARLMIAKLGEQPDSDPREIELEGHPVGLRLAPQGEIAVVQLAPTALIDDEYMNSRLTLVDLAEGAVLRQFETTGKLGQYAVSPDGQTLALIAGADRSDPAATTLFLADMDSGALTALNAGAADAAEHPAWLADGRLAVTFDVGVASRLRIYEADGTLTEEIDPGELILTALEQAGGTLAVEAETPTHPSELYVLDGGEFTRWTHHNPWLDEIDFGTQRAITYTARDGQQIEGVLIEPAEGVERGGAPTIMSVHGGPESHVSNGWLTSYSLPGQVAAGRGYAIFHPNYRGSTGYGVSFARQHQGDYAGKEFDDVLDGKQALVDAGIADPERTGITGGSYGGYASAWGATAHSEHYAASVMFVGIGNNISKFGTTDIPTEMHLVHELGWPWEEWDMLLESSPIAHAGNAGTPILILHGEDDTRVSSTQSRELYRHIKLRRPETPLRLVLYPGEKHGNRKAAARYDYNLRMMQWFDTYLKTGDRTAPLPPPRAVMLEVPGE